MTCSTKDSTVNGISVRGIGSCVGRLAVSGFGVDSSKTFTKNAVMGNADVLELSVSRLRSVGCILVASSNNSICAGTIISCVGGGVNCRAIGGLCDRCDSLGRGGSTNRCSSDGVSDTLGTLGSGTTRRNKNGDVTESSPPETCDTPSSISGTGRASRDGTRDARNNGTVRGPLIGIRGMGTSNVLSRIISRDAISKGDVSASTEISKQDLRGKAKN